jgi:hypothetical protein
MFLCYVYRVARAPGCGAYVHCSRADRLSPWSSKENLLARDAARVRKFPTHHRAVAGVQEQPMIVIDRVESLHRIEGRE